MLRPFLKTAFKQNCCVKGVGTPREAPKNVFWDVSVFSSDSGREMIVSGSSKH